MAVLEVPFLDDFHVVDHREDEALLGAEAFLVLDIRRDLQFNTSFGEVCFAIAVGLVAKPAFLDEVADAAFVVLVFMSCHISGRSFLCRMDIP